MKTLALMLALLAGLVTVAEAKPVQKVLYVFDNDGRVFQVKVAHVRVKAQHPRRVQKQTIAQRHFKNGLRRSAAPLAAIEENVALGGFESGIVRTARRYVGTNPGRWQHPRLWCMEFVNKVLREAGHRAISSARARDAVAVGARVPRAAVKPGDLVVYGHHVGFFVRWQGRLPVIISGNFNRVVAEAPHGGTPIAFVRPG